jgi:hypothetical protein
MKYEYTDTVVKKTMTHLVGKLLKIKVSMVKTNNFYIFCLFDINL